VPSHKTSTSMDHILYNQYLKQFVQPKNSNFWNLVKGQPGARSSCLRMVRGRVWLFWVESASRPLVGFGVLNDNLIKCLISFVKVHEQILSNRYKDIHGYITRSTIMMKMELCDQCV
jgi:hypothetical protein